MAEVCYGCGIVADKHPMVAVGKFEDGVALDGEVSERGYGAAPVCDACWKDPGHRTLHSPIKGAFFPRSSAESARQAADPPNGRLGMT